MPVREVQLTDDLDSFVSAEVENGHFRDADHLMAVALRTLRDTQMDYEQKMAQLCAALDDGLASGVYEGDAFEDVRRELDLPPFA